MDELINKSVKEQIKSIINELNGSLIENAMSRAPIYRGESQIYKFPCTAQLIRLFKQGEYGDLGQNSEYCEGEFNFRWLEEGILKEFRRRTLPELGSEKRPKSDLEWLAIAQHYGLPTRLLDWTTNPLVALFFAVETNNEHEGVIYYRPYTGMSEYDELHKYNLSAGILSPTEQGSNQLGLFMDNTFQPLDLREREDRILYFRPEYNDKRFSNQRTVLGCPAEYDISTYHGVETLLVIPSNLKPYLRRYLASIGIDHSFIYPGLTGDAYSVQAQFIDQHKYRTRRIP